MLLLSSFIGIILIHVKIHFSDGQYAMYDCPGGWVDYTDSCYKFVKNPVRNIEGMKQHCNYDGASGLSINSESEHTFVVQQLEQLSELESQNWWTSGRREAEESAKFYWEGDGTPVESYVYWHNSSIPLQTGKNHIAYHYDGFKWAWILGIGTEVMPFICEISKAEIYKIRREERGPGYGNENPDPASWERGPYFITEPSETVYDINSVDTFTYLDCIADGKPPPDYVWYKERAGEVREIKVEEDQRYTMVNGRLIIDQPSQERNDDGNYRCKASNTYGGVISLTAPLKFGYLHDFPKSPRSAVNAVAFSWASIECNPPAHFPEILYAWYKNDIYNFIRPELKPYLFISNDGRLYFSEVTSDDIGQYYCMVYKPGSGTSEGKVSMPTQLTVRESSPAIYEPVIGSGFPLVYPNAPMVGQNIRLECWAHGTCQPPQFLIYTWDKVEGTRTLPLPKQARLIDHNRVLLIDNIQSHDAGTYRCNVRRPNGQSVSHTVQVLLQAVPYFILPLKDQYADQGGNLTWRCEASGEPAATYQWLKNGVAMRIAPEDVGRVSISNNVLRFERLDADKDSGMYQCAASNIHGTRYSNAELKVLKIKPSFAKQPLQPNQFATQGGNTTILCRPEAAPTPTITWRKDGRPLNPGTDETARIQQMPNGHLFILRVDKSADEGVYMCIAENMYGVSNSSGRLTVLPTTTISWAPESIGVNVNQTAYLNCMASHDPQLDITYIWYHNGILVEFEKIFMLGEQRYQLWKHPHFIRRIPGWYMGGLYIVNAQTEHQGRYTCVVETPVDSFSNFADLVVKGPPSEPAGVRIQEGSVTQTSVVILWKQPADNGEQITSYVVEAYNKWEGIWKVFITNVRVLPDDTQTLRYNVTNLRPYSDYFLRMRAENIIGTSVPSVPSPQFTTYPTKPDLVPEQVGGGGGKTGDLQITWKPLDPWQHNGPGLKYLVYAKDAGDVEWDWQEYSKEPGRHVILVGEQNYYRQYDVAVQAINDIGVGPVSPTVRIRSAMALPTVIAQNVRAQPFNSTACLVHWIPVEDRREVVKGKLGGYRLSYWKEFGETEVMGMRVTLDGQADEGLVIALDPDTPYYFDVMVWNEAGNGPKSQWFIQRTLRRAPINQPVEVQIERLSSNSINVWWRGVSTNQLEEPLLGYKVRIWREGEHIKAAKDYDALKETDLVIDDLRSDILYKLRVFGYSRGGDGAQSSPTIKFMLGAGAAFRASLILLAISTLTSALHIWTPS